MCVCYITICRWNMRVIYCRTAPWWIYVEPLCCGVLQKASFTLPPKSIWRLSGRRSMQRAHSAPWVLTHSPSPACNAAAPSPLWRTSSLGSTWPVATCTATTTGATVQSRSPTLSESVPCAEWSGPTCHCGWAVSRPSMWTQVHPLMPLCHVDTCVRRSQSSTGQRSLCPTAPTPSTPPAPSVPPSSASLRAFPS